MTSMAAKFGHAEQLARTGRREDARDALLALVNAPDADPNVHAIATELMGLAGFPEETKRLFDDYTDRYKPADVLYEQEEPRFALREDAARQAARNERRTYRRADFIRRALMGDVVIDESGISLRQRFKKRRYRWSEVVGAALDRQEMSTQVEGGADRWWVSRIMRLRVPDGELVLDLSSTLPAFERPDLIEEEIRRRVSVRDSPVKLRRRRGLMRVELSRAQSIGAGIFALALMVFVSSLYDGAALGDAVIGVIVFTCWALLLMIAIRRLVA